MLKRFGLVVLCSSVGIAGCSDDPGPKGPEKPPEEELTGTEWPTIPQTEPGPGKGTDGFDFSTARPSGQARAGRQAATPRRIFGEEARCRPGDFLLENNHLRACVSDVLSGDAFQTTGGKLVDLVPTDNPNFDELDSFGTVIGLREGSADSVEIVSDGSDGGPAVVRVTGVDLPLRLITGTMGGAATGSLSPASYVNVVTEYRLGADARYIELTTWVSPDGQPISKVSAGTFALLGDLLTPWRTGRGLNAPVKGDTPDLMVLFGSEHTWGFRSPGGEFFGNILAMLGPSLYIDYGAKGSTGTRGPAVFQRYLTVAEQGGTPEIEALFGDLVPSRPAGAHNVVFDAATGAGWGNPIWSIERVSNDADSTDALAVLRFAATDTQELALDAGDYVAVPLRWPSPDPAPFSFTVSGDGVVSLPSPGMHTLTIADVKDENGVSIPAQIVANQVGGAYSKTDYYVTTGPLAMVLPPGMYTVEVSRGEGLSFASHAVDLTAGNESLPATVLTPEWVRDGWVSGDFHQHAMRSSDSEVRSLTRLYGNLGTGVDIMGASDHDVVEDYATLAQEAGVDHLVHVFQGSEISPVRSHINVFPTPYDPTRSAFGSPSVVERVDRRGLRQLTNREILSAARAAGVTYVQVNHGRDSSSALMNWVKYNPATDRPETNEQDWPESFEAMEIYNRASVFCLLFRDWHAMLMHGKKVVGVGNSDTHNLSSPVGYPRNWIHVGDKQNALTDDVIIDNLKQLHVSTSGGILIRWEDHLPGETVTASAGVNTLAVTVDVPSWSSVEHLTVAVNGNPVKEISVLPGTLVDGHARFEFDVTLSGDSTVTVLGWSTQAMSAVQTGRRPFGFVNPLFMDVGGDGWTAPGAAAAAAVGVLDNVPFCASNASLDYDPHEYMHHHAEDESDKGVHSHEHSHSHSHNHGHSHGHGADHGHGHGH